MNHIHVFEPARNGSRRTIVALHGTGGNEHSLIPLVRSVDSDAAVLSPRGNVLEGSAPRFFRRLAEGVFDEADLIRRADELGSFIIESSEKYGFDLGQTYAVGYSNGANIAAAVLFLCPEALAGAALLRSMVPLEPETAPNLVGKHVLMLTGESDAIVQVSNAQRLEQMFRGYGAEVKFELLKTGHELTRRDLELLSDWLKRLSVD